MDSGHSYARTTTVSTSDTRRGVLRLMAALPVAGTLAALLGDGAEAAAQKDPERGGSHRRRKRKRRHDPGADKDNRKGERKGKGKGKRKKKPAASPTSPTSPPPTSPGRTTVTRTFTNPTPITILSDPSFGAEFATPASPCPSVIAVAGFANGRILDVTLTLHGLSHTFPNDIDILLAAAHLPGLNAVVMSDAGEGKDVSDVTLTLDDQAAAALPSSGALATGTFRPKNRTHVGTEEFPAPAPAPSGNVGLSVFTGSDPNGIWQLFVVDDVGIDGGRIANGWSLEITAEVDA